MTSVARYLAQIGRRGGIKSRRVLDPETARRMVAARETRRAAKRALNAVSSLPLAGTPADTNAAAQTVVDALVRRLTAAEKLAQVVRLSRMVDRLAVEGLRQRHPADDDAVIRYRRTELRLGRELAARVYPDRRVGA